MPAATRLFYLRIAVVVSAIAGMALSHKLWLSTRFYPLAPVFAFLKPPPSPLDWILFSATLLVLAACAFTPRLIPIFATLAIILVLCDQSRLQPWFYEYFFLLLGVAFVSPNACRMIIASVYFWSGVQKFNEGFVTDVFPWMLEPFLRHLPHSAEKLVHPLSVAAPFIEMAIGLALLSRRLRTPAVIAAVAMHIFILISLFGQQYNHVVWPWNIAMAAFAVILFWKFDGNVLAHEGWLQIVVLLLFTIAPLLSFFGYWDHYLSAAMYTSNRNQATIYFSDKNLEKLPDGIADYARVETPELDSIDINEWSAGELKVPPYPEVRIFKSIGRKLCQYADVTLSVTGKTTVGSRRITRTSYTCAALNK